MEQRYVFDLLPAEWKEAAEAYGEKGFRGKQIFGWLAKGAELPEMSNVPKRLREVLMEDYEWHLPEVVIEQTSETDGTKKCLLEFPDGSRVESVFMKYHYGNSICISSQVGCRMGCTFCASTRKGLVRSLSGGEMLAEVLAMCKLTKEEINHVVIMGIGEPFDNYESLSRFLQLIHAPEGYNLSLRNITVSTCGLLPRIAQFAEDFPQVNLAVSLHAPNDEIRRRTMPIARKYPYEQLMDMCRAYTEKTGRRITFEYAMIAGVNDGDEHARELAELLGGWLTHVNLIPLNEVEGTGYAKAKEDRIRSFSRILEHAGVAVTVRRTLGSDIDAACGQLRLR